MTSSQNAYFDGLALKPPQRMMFAILMLAYFFQQFGNWSLSFLGPAVIDSFKLNESEAIQSLIYMLDFLEHNFKLETFVIGYQFKMILADLNKIHVDRVISNIGYWYYLGMALGGICAGLISDYFGRRKALLLGIAIFSFASLAASLSPTAGVFIVFRTITGFGVFFLMVTSHTYIAEMSPSGRRAFYQCLVPAVGFCSVPVSAFLSISITALDHEAWRFIVGFPVVGLLSLALGFVYLQESPRWLMSKNRPNEALRVFQQLSGVTRPLPVDIEPQGRSPLCAPLMMINSRYWLRTMVLIFLFGTITSATFIHILWTTKLLIGMLRDVPSGLEVTGYITIGIPCGCLLGAFLGDSLGRKRSLLLLMSANIVSSFMMYQSSAFSSVLLSGFLINLFALPVSFILFVYCVEQYPSWFRNTASGLLSGAGRAIAAVVTLIVPWIIGLYGEASIFLVVAALFLLCLPILLIFGRETANTSLEELSR